MSEHLEAWRKVWRAGAPLLPTAGLKALATALETDDPALVQGMTTEPPPLQLLANWTCEKACVVGYTGWKGEGLTTIEEVESFFADWCTTLEEHMGFTAAAPCRWFLQWADETPRDQMRSALLPEVRRELQRRRESAA